MYCFDFERKSIFKLQIAKQSDHNIVLYGKHTHETVSLCKYYCLN